MENATKALLIAGGVLIGVMILSLGATLFASMSSYVQTSQEEIKYNDLNAFNTQFLKYANASNLTIHDVVTAANLANENNTSYNYYISYSDEQINDKIRGNQDQFYVAVYLNGNSIESDIQDKMADLISTNLIEYKDEDGNGKLESVPITIECIEVQVSQTTGRVYEIYFKTK